MNQIKPSSEFFEPNQRLTIKKEFDVKKIKRILVIGIDQLGGLMMSSPFFRELRRCFPEAYIVNLVAPLTYGVMTNCPYVDEVWKFDKKRSLKTAFKIRQQGFDLSFNMAGTFRTGLMTWIGNVDNRVGYDTDGTGKFLTVELNGEFSSRYRPENVFDLLRALGFSPQNIYDREAWFGDEDQAYAKDWYEKQKSPKAKILAFNPYSTDPKRRWTDDAWTAFIKGIQEKNIMPIMMVAPNEVEPAEALLARWGLKDIPIETHSITQTAAIFKHIDYVIGPESGFVHLALAANKPKVVALFNVLPPKSTFPIGDSRYAALIKDDLNCCPCYLYKFKDQCPNDLQCMTQLDASRALKAIDVFEAQV